MKLTKYQRDAVEELKDDIQHDWKKGRESNNVLKAITGAGKTVALAIMLDEFIEEWDEDFVVLWVSPGKGGLLDQSYESVLGIIGQSRRIYKYYASITSMSPGDVMFVNWEKLNKKNNTAMKDGEKSGFKDLINSVHFLGYKIMLIVDESHKNFNADKSKQVVDFINPNCVIKASATPDDKPTVVIPSVEVVEAGMIKKSFWLNKEMGIKEDDEVLYVLKSADKCFRVIQDRYAPHGIKPLMLINITNAEKIEYKDKDGKKVKGDVIDPSLTIEKYQASQGRTYENGKLAIWTADRKENINNLSDFNSNVEVLIFKQAITEGWDAPRSCVLVELRQGMKEAFKLQVAGRIFRMPERKHYGDEWLDNAFVFSNDKNLTLEQDYDGPPFGKLREIKLKPGVSLSLESYTIKRDWSDIQVEDGKFEEIFYKVGELEE